MYSLTAPGVGIVDSLSEVSRKADLEISSGLEHEHGGGREHVVLDSHIKFSGLLGQKEKIGLKRTSKKEGYLIAAMEKTAFMILSVNKTVSKVQHRPPVVGFYEAVFYPGPPLAEIDHGHKAKISPESSSNILIIGKDVQISGLISVPQAKCSVIESTQGLIKIFGYMSRVFGDRSQELEFHPVSVCQTGLAIEAKNSVEVVLSVAICKKGSKSIFI
jgi:hypothetical protein